jgi:hypothetical protein
MSELTIYNAYFSARWRAKLVVDPPLGFDQTFDEALRAAKKQVRQAALRP